MDFFGDLFQRLRDLPALVQWAGYVGLFAIIFTETGLFFGFFLPGDSLLVTAGLLISQNLPLDLTTMGALLDKYREKYFITGEINSTVDDAQAVMDAINEQLLVLRLMQGAANDATASQGDDMETLVL